MRLNIIAAMCKNRGIGFKNALPWSFKSDMSYFTRITQGDLSKEYNAVIMGRKTWESLPRTLSDRENLIISKTLEGKNIYPNIESCIKYCIQQNFPNVWIIGGQTIYEQTIENPYLDKIYLTVIDKEYECDAFFPPIPNDFNHQGLSYTIEHNTKVIFNVYERAPYRRRPPGLQSSPWALDLLLPGISDSIQTSNYKS